MPRYPFERPACAALLDQLIAAGFSPDTTVEMDATRCWVTCEPEQYDMVATVVAAHDATAIDAAVAQAQVRRRQARQAILGYPDLAAPTNAQTVAAVKALCLAVAEPYRAP